MKEYQVEGHASTYLPDAAENYQLIWSDEFDGDTLDRSKWDFRLSYWGRPNPAYTDAGVVVKNGCVELHRTEKDGLYVSPQLQTGANSFDGPLGDQKNPWKQTGFWPIGEVKEPHFMHRYGYYECRCKFQREPWIMWSAFWLQSPSIGMTYDPAWSGVESDIMEYFEPDKITSGNIHGGYGNQFRETARINYPFAAGDDFHTFGLLWTEREYVFYCDGKETARSYGPVSHVPQFVLLTTEVVGYRYQDPRKVPATGAVDDAFICDYVRVFDLPHD